MEDKQLNELESMELISRMIRNAQKNLQSQGGTLFLIWGYVSLFATLTVLILLLLGQEAWCMWLWWLVPLVGYPLSINFLSKQKKIAKTMIDRIITTIWSIVGVSCMFVAAIGMLGNYEHYILFIECLLLNIAVTLTGFVIQFKPVWIGGMLGFAATYSLPFLMGEHWMWQLAIFAFCILVTMVIPGHFMNHIEKNSVCSKD
jgi:hypothetical protein